ncbi:hypothetical protein RB597_009531 [Gaeumannomyces tritici]
MARPVHRETLFHLEPRDEETARAMRAHPENASFISMSRKGTPSLEIGYHVSSRPRGGRVIARVGRDADICFPTRADVAEVHIAFEVHPVSRAILLCVRASNRRSVTVEPHGLREDGDVRQIVIEPPEEPKITIGAGPRALRFKVRWHGGVGVGSTAAAVDRGFEAAEARAVVPRWLKTADEGDDDIWSWYDTRMPSKIGCIVRDAVKRGFMGEGTYGAVFEAVDRDSGHPIALKAVRPRTEYERECLKREIKTMSSLSHPYIIDFLGYKGDPSDFSQPEVGIFMPLRTGNLRSLLPIPKREENAILNAVGEQMFSALDYLSARGLCHRDVKPANILYDVGEDGSYTFQLADFGLANWQSDTTSFCGTKVFTAPELHCGQHRQSHKMDMWSLLVTMISIVGASRFDEEELGRKPHSAIVEYVLATTAEHLPFLEPMARVDPDNRASAAQMLVAYFRGKGLATSRSMVGPIPEVDTGSPACCVGAHHTPPHRTVSTRMMTRSAASRSSASSRTTGSPLSSPASSEASSAAGPSASPSTTSGRSAATSTTASTSTTGSVPNDESCTQSQLPDAEPEHAMAGSPEQTSPSQRWGSSGRVTKTRSPRVRDREHRRQISRVTRAIRNSSRNLQNHSG